MKKDNKTNMFFDLETYPSEFLSLARGVISEIEEDSPELLSGIDEEHILQLIRDELSRVLGLQSITESKTMNVSWSDLRSMFRRYLLGLKPQDRKVSFEPVANEMGYYSWKQFIGKLNLIQKASKGNVK